MAKKPRPKLSLLHERIPEHLKQFMHLTKLAEMGRLTASVAHEINNPLAAILGCAENLEILLQNKNVDHDLALRQVSEILKSAHRASDVIKRMGHLSRKEDHPMSVVDIADLTLNASEYLKKQMQDLEIEFLFEFSRPIPARCDSTQVEQILVNILSNAIHALQKQPLPRKIKVSFYSNDSHHHIKVWNNGPAIPLEIREKLTEPFFTTKDKGEGSGLGLSISQSIMHAHEGSLSFTSSDGDGTEFVLSFPRLADEPWHTPLAPQAGNVIVIDRQPHFRKTMAEKFKILGYEVVSVEDVTQALVALRQSSNVACAVYDIVPGSIDSLTGIQILRKGLGPSCPIITVSAYPSARDNPSELKGRGATECFQKPLRVEHFNAILELTKKPLKKAA